MVTGNFPTIYCVKCKVGNLTNGNEDISIIKSDSGERDVKREGMFMGQGERGRRSSRCLVYSLQVLHVSP